MTKLNTEDLISQLNWRYATKKFDSTKKIPSEIWSKLEEALILSPSSFGLQPWKFYVINDQKIREALKPASWNQAQITEASHLVVFAKKKSVDVEDVDNLIKAISSKRNIDVDSLKGYKDVIMGFVQSRSAEELSNWSARQVYIALGFLLSSAAVLGVDACPMEGFDPAKYDEILDLKNSEYSAIVVATLGYRAKDDSYADAPKVRFEKRDIVTYV